MRITYKTAAGIISLFLLIATPLVCRGDTALTVHGLASIEDGNLAQAEKLALSDAFAKAAFHAALRYVPETSVADLMQSLPDYASSRGMRDILQYQITSRTQRDDTLLLSVDVRLDDDSLRQWLHERALTIPRAQRSKILLAISYLAPGSDAPYEWWASDKGYSPFESQLAQELERLGENVLAAPMVRKGGGKPLDPVEAARTAGADMLITGTIAYTPVLDTLYECAFEVSLVDVATGEPVSSRSASHRGDMPLKVMNALMIDEVIEPVRAAISKRILSEAPGLARKTLCVEGISDYVTYQSMITALRSMDGVSRISITGIHGHSICHIMEVSGRLSDVMENLRRRQIARADIQVEAEVAYIRLIQ
ncbi:MAG: hypothetical protein WAR22_04785 [Desulfomonilia bacterium]|jgi:hypothetical protein